MVGSRVVGGWCRVVGGWGSKTTSTYTFANKKRTANRRAWLDRLLLRACFWAGRRYVSSPSWLVLPPGQHGAASFLVAYRDVTAGWPGLCSPLLSFPLLQSATHTHVHTLSRAAVQAATEALRRARRRVVVVDQWHSRRASSQALCMADNAGSWDGQQLLCWLGLGCRSRQSGACSYAIECAAAR